MSSSRIFPYFNVGDETRKVIKQSDARAKGMTHETSPEPVETRLVPIDEPFYRSYITEVAEYGGTVYFAFDAINDSARFSDTFATGNLSTAIVEPAGLTDGLLRTDDGVESSGSALFIPAEGETVYLRLKEPVWPGSLVFWIQTEGALPSATTPSRILKTIPTPPDDAATPLVQGSMLAQLEESGHLTFETLDETDTVLRSVTSSQPITDGLVHSLIYADDGTTLTMYIDGVAV